MAPSIFTFLPPCSCSVCFHIKLGVTHFFHQFLLQQIQKAGRFFLLSTNPIFSKICMRHLLTLFFAFLIYLLIFSPTRLVILYYFNELKRFQCELQLCFISHHHHHLQFLYFFPDVQQCFWPNFYYVCTLPLFQPLPYYGLLTCSCQTIHLHTIFGHA